MIGLAAAAAGLAVSIGGGCSTQVTGTAGTCSSFCNHISALVCSSSSCTSECQQAEGHCAALGRSTEFQSLLDCASSATYACQGDPPAPTTSACNAQLRAVQGCGATLVNSPPPFPSFDGGLPLGTPDGSADSASGEAAVEASPSDGGPLDAPVDAPPDGDQACAMWQDKLDCEYCCLNDHSEGYNTLLNAELACLCGDAGPCSSTCATEFCMMLEPTAGDPCDMCVYTSLSSGGVCNGPVLDQCVRDPDCASLLACYDPCRQKP